MFNWTCPHCNRSQTVVSQRFERVATEISVGNISDGSLSACYEAIGCSNPDCTKLTLTFSVRPYHWVGGKVLAKLDEPPVYIRRVIPDSGAKPQPDCIPAALIVDYSEACLIRDDSPKAPATLSRRCLQGMIRDFCGIADGTLAKEIATLRNAVDSGHAPPGVTSESVDAIDHVRSVGNIGAHMEKDIDVIVPVEPDEAQILIDLVEMLFEEWYVARETRKNRLAAIGKLSAAKKQIIADGRAAPKASET